MNNEKVLCPFIDFMSFLTKKWILVIIKSISEGCKSYTDIERSLTGVNPRILSSRLKELQEKGFVEKKILSEVPLRAIYCLTEKGEGLSHHIESLAKWVNKNLD
ncbi:MAG: helix-turn-helix domain-containing protein [Candidatus Gracilibacteria bacterium]|nr:helix-turn-helix domain-containing protein [Candidatus Gracilibacteria bacterium]